MIPDSLERILLFQNLDLKMTAKFPKISIIIPVYNVEKYILACLQSIAQQTYKGDIECILIDDCCQDSSVSLITRFIQDYSGVIEFRILRHVSNKGSAAARNTGIKEASGDYIFFIDSDDSITADCLDVMGELLLRYPGVDLVYAGATTTDSNNWLSMNQRKNFPEYTDNQMWIKCNIFNQRIPMTAWNKLVKMSVIRDSCIFFEEGLLIDDEIWNWKLSKVIKSAACCYRDTYEYRIHPGSIMTNSNLFQRKWDAIQQNAVFWINSIDDYLPNEQKAYIFYRLLQFLLAPPPCSSISEIRDLFILLSNKSTLRQKMAIYILFCIPLSGIRRVGPLQRFAIDLYGQYNNRRYIDNGLLYYLKRL